LHDVDGDFQERKRRGAAEFQKAVARQEISPPSTLWILRAVEQDAHRGSSTEAAGYGALARDLRQRRLMAIIEEYEAEHGAITDKELAAAREKWRG
jgi:hypothetical protein